MKAGRGFAAATDAATDRSSDQRVGEQRARRVCRGTEQRRWQDEERQRECTRGDRHET